MVSLKHAEIMWDSQVAPDIMYSHILRLGGSFRFVKLLVPTTQISPVPSPISTFSKYAYKPIGSVGLYRDFAEMVGVLIWIMLRFC